MINYWESPPKYDVKLLENYEQDAPPISGSANAEARNEALIERALSSGGKMTVIQSKISNGEGSQMVMTVIPAGFWADNGGRWIGDGEAKSTDYDPNIYEDDLDFDAHPLPEDDDAFRKDPRVRKSMDIINLLVFGFVACRSDEIQFFFQVCFPLQPI